MSSSEIDYASIIMSCMCTNLRITARIISQIYDQELSSIKIKATQFTLLVAIAYRKSITITDLSEMLGMDITSLSRGLKILEKNDYIHISTNKDDKRSKNVTVTEDGKKIIVKAIPMWTRAQQKVERKYSKDKMKDILSNLNLLQQALK
ncbi:MAG: MarR family winged helix-turn-helix transcriptional regulator [Candidatus Thorarchaeota archaeon]